MKITPIRTHKVLAHKESLDDLLNRYVKQIKERSILAVTSKVVSLCEGNVKKVGTIDKKELVRSTADYFFPLETSKYSSMLTIKNNFLVFAAGIDESNGNGYYIMWPKNPQRSANKIRSFLKKSFSLKNIGVIITDSKTTTLRRGTTGFALAHSGFNALNDYIGEPDIFGRAMQLTMSNIADALAASAVATMGEGKEQTPLALIENIPFASFQNRNPTQQELNELNINIDDDLYAPILKGVKWTKGRK